eukprot:PhF_6_TR43650/c0_g1_i1/m.67074
MTDTGPCGEQASKWRACLKSFDYGPDREVGACGIERAEYYACNRSFRQSLGVDPDVDKSYELPTECKKTMEDFHECMMVHAFIVDNCRKSMDKLTACHQKYTKTKK